MLGLALFWDVMGFLRHRFLDGVVGAGYGECRGASGDAALSRFEARKGALGRGGAVFPGRFVGGGDVPRDRRWVCCLEAGVAGCGGSWRLRREGPALL